MAVYRQIQVSYWQDPFVLSLTPEEKYFYIYLMTNQKTTQCGIYELSRRAIEFETGYNRETVDKLLERFQQYRKLLVNDETQEIMLTNWMKHNAIKSKAVMTCIAKELGQVKFKPFIDVFLKVCRDTKYPIETVYTPSSDGLERLTRDSGEEKEKEEEEEEEEEKEEEQNRASVPSLNSDFKDSILKLIKECDVKNCDLYSLDNIYAFINVVENQVIEAAIKKAQGKHVNYALNTLTNWVGEGKTKLEHVSPPPKVAQIDFKQRSNGKKKIEIVTNEPTTTISDEEYEEMLRYAAEMQQEKRSVNQ